MSLYQDILDFQAIHGEKFDTDPPASFMEAHAEAKTTYLAQATDYLMKTYSLPEDTKSFVHHLCYLANRTNDKLAAVARLRDMESKGFKAITLSSWADVPTSGKAELVLDLTDNLFGTIKTIVCRLGVNRTSYGNHAFFFQPRNRRKGYDAASLALASKPAFYRVIA